MDSRNVKTLSFARELQNEISKVNKPPEDGFVSEQELVIPLSIVRGTRGYIVQVTNQANGCYEKGWYDACSVMVRRLLETLIIETYEHYGIDSKIKNVDGNFFSLKDLITSTLSETSWNLSRNTKNALHKLKEIGDLSAHSRRYNAHQKDVEPLLRDIRIVVQEFIYLATLK